MNREARAETDERPLHYLSLREVARRLESGQLSPVELARHMLDRIADVDATLKSYATVTAAEAMSTAEAAEREIRAGSYRGLLHGVPLAVKDLCCTKGVRTMAGTRVLADFVPDFDAAVVARLRDAGAVLLGKLNLTEGALAGYHPERDIPLNPWDRGRWPGMSSSGSGVAVAAGLCFGAIGTDTGGSIRFPSSACGVVGLKPTYGRVSRFGVLPLAESLDHVGPMCRETGDLAAMFDVIAGNDPRDPTSLADWSPGLAGCLDLGVEGLTIGIDREYALAGIDPGLAGAFQEALGVLVDLGTRVVEVRMAGLDGADQVWMTICTAEAVAAHAANYPSRAGEYGPYFRQALEMGSRVTSRQLSSARRTRARFAKEFTDVLESVDVMVCPAGGDPAWPITREIQLGSMPEYHAAWHQAAPRAADFTMPMNLAGTPAICLPCGFSPEGLPYSIQFAGRWLSEATLCRVAHAYEQATKWHTRRPDLSA